MPYLRRIVTPGPANTPGDGNCLVSAFASRHRLVPCGRRGGCPAKNPTIAGPSTAAGQLCLVVLWVPFFIAALLLTAPLLAIAGEGNLPLGKRISFEKVQIAEEYRLAVEHCRREQRQALREKCMARKKMELHERLEMLDSDPRLYFEKKNRPEEEGRKAARKGSLE